MRSQEIVERRVFYPGETLFREGELIEKLWLIKSGSVSATSERFPGLTVEAPAGCMIGDAPLINGQNPLRHMSTIKGAATGEIMSLDLELFSTALKSASPMTRAWIKSALNKSHMALVGISPGLEDMSLELERAILGDDLVGDAGDKGGGNE